MSHKNFVECQSSTKDKVLVIGGGPSGIIAIKEFTSSNAFEVLCVEQLSVVGGLWNYCDVITQPNHPTGSSYTSVYKNLKTNVSHHLMSYSDMPYPDHLPSYISHTDVKEYYLRYVHKHKLHKYIKFNTKVLSVKPKMEIGKEDRWEVEWMNVLSKETETRQFDIVIVCSGIHSEPRLPVIKGMSEFEGELIHSQEYRDPEHFRNKKVVLIGAGPSGFDISLEVSKTAQKVWLCHRGFKESFPDSIEQFKEIVEFKRGKVVFKKWKDKETNPNGTSSENDDEIKNDKKVDMKKKPDENDIKDGEVVKIEEVDVVIFCTGYNYSFPFLNANCGVSAISTGVVGPLYKDTICLNRQTLCFIGLHLYNITLLYEFQAKFLKAFYEKKFTIPPFGKDLLRLIKQDDDKKKSKDVNVDEKPLCIPFYQFELMSGMAEMAGFKKLHDRYEIHFKERNHKREIYPEIYKNIDYQVGSDGHLQEKSRPKH